MEEQSRWPDLAPLGSELWVLTVKSMHEYVEAWDKLVDRYSQDRVRAALEEMRKGNDPGDEDAASDIAALGREFFLGAHGPPDPHSDDDVGASDEISQELPVVALLGFSPDLRRAHVSIDLSASNRRLGPELTRIKEAAAQERQALRGPAAVDEAGSDYWAEKFRLLVACRNHPEKERWEVFRDVVSSGHEKDSARREAERYLNEYLPPRLAQERDRLADLREAVERVAPWFRSGDPTPTGALPMPSPPQLAPDLLEALQIRAQRIGSRTREGFSL